MIRASKTLPNGCRLMRVSAGEIVIAGPGDVPEILVGPSVDGYAVRGDRIAGHVEPPRRQVSRDISGYFLVDCRTGEVHSGLSVEEWHEILRGAGLNVSHLQEPSRFGRF